MKKEIKFLALNLGMFKPRRLVFVIGKGFLFFFLGIFEVLSGVKTGTKVALIKQSKPVLKIIFNIKIIQNYIKKFDFFWNVISTAHKYKSRNIQPRG